jgi:cytochrome c peroxidase
MVYTNIIKQSTFVLLLSFLLLACDSEVRISDSEQSSEFDWGLPSGVYAPRVPASNPISDAKVELGRHLFYDKRLSGNQTQSCASCHEQDKAFSDGRARGKGSTDELHLRSPQQLSNVGYYTAYTWANSALFTLEDQMNGPLMGNHPVEMGINDENRDEIMTRFSSNPFYDELFQKAFNDVENPYQVFYVTQAIASFERTLNSFDSPYDRYERGDKSALSAAQIRGKNLFFSEKAECFHCHSGEHFSDSTANEKSFFINSFFHNTGLYNIAGSGEFPTGNRGIYELSGKTKDMGKFRASILKNIEVTAPFMHDGSLETLRDVVDFYAEGGRNIEEGEFIGDGRENPNLSPLVARIDLNEQEREDLVAFLESLTDESFLTSEKISDPFKDTE